VPYQTGALWAPVIDNVEDKLAVGRRIIKSVDYAKAVAKYLENDGATYEQALSPAQVTALRSQFLTLMTQARDALNVALA
jgi:hypothetical protein